MRNNSVQVREPKDGKTTRVIIVARISTDHQDIRSLEDQQALCRERIESDYDGPIQYRVIQSRGSGEHLDREELDELKDAIESGELDVVIAEDLGRICRRNRCIDFCELCQDHETRLLAVSDHVDTTEEGWQDAAAMASWHHERSNRYTSGRIKRSCNNRFDQGQLMESMIFGYVVPEGAKCDTEVQKDPVAEPIIKEIFRRLEAGATYSEIADWLEAQNVPTGPYCRVKKWGCATVSRFVHNRLLKGERIRNRLITKRHNKSGRHRSVKAPPEMLRIRECPHLAYFDTAYYDHVIALVDARNACFRRAKPGQPDVRKGVPRSRTAWPGQHVCCGVCGRQLYWTRCGKERALMCSGAQTYRCWNSLILTETACRESVIDRILDEIRTIPDFDHLLNESIIQSLSMTPDDRKLRRKGLAEQRQTAKTGRDNILAAIEKGVNAEQFVLRVQDLEAEIKELDYQIQLLDREPRKTVSPPTREEALELVRKCFAESVSDDPEAIRLLRRLIPQMYLVPYRCVDGRGIECRIHLTLNLVPLLGAEEPLPQLEQIVVRDLVLDAFRLPQKVKFLDAVQVQRSQYRTERQIAAELGITQPAVQHVMKLARRMQELGTSEPYLPLHEPLTDEKTRLRRHLHPRYVFEPLEGFPMY